MAAVIHNHLSSFSLSECSLGTICQKCGSELRKKLKALFLRITEGWWDGGSHLLGAVPVRSLVFLGNNCHYIHSSTSYSHFLLCLFLKGLVEFGDHNSLVLCQSTSQAGQKPRTLNCCQGQTLHVNFLLLEYSVSKPRGAVSESWENENPRNFLEHSH